MRNRSPLSFFAPVAMLGLALLAAPAGAEVYPTDRCVASKMDAVAAQCRALFNWEAAGRTVERFPLDRLVEQAGERLESAWVSAEAASADAGVDCSQTTASSGELLAQLRAAADTVADEAGVGEGRGRERACAAGALRAAGRACHDLLAARSAHLLNRQDDRDRSELETATASALETLESSLERCSAGDVAGSLVAAVDGLATSLTVSPAVPDSEWMTITPEPVEYEGVLRRPICSGGTPYHYYAKRGTVNKLVMYYQGGGACWNYFTCGQFPTYKQTVNRDGENPANFQSGFADASNPDNPFRDWHQVFVPYCTGDVHWGDVTFDHEVILGGGVPDSVTIEHRGFTNAKVAEKFAREHFVNPEQVFVTGSSAGAYGAIVNSLSLLEFVYPSSDFAVLGDAGNGVITQDFLVNDLSKWGIEDNLPEWIPGLNVPLTELNMGLVYVEAANTYPSARFGTFTTAYDGGTGGQTGFFNVMRNPTNPLAWQFWWNASCDWNTEMLALNQVAIQGASNYRQYVGTGSAHTTWGRNRVYDDTTGGVPTVRDWVVAMLEGSEDWVNVVADDFGVLLPGDPRPEPPQDPFTADGRIVCE